jgi:hypothetical protein
MTQQSNPTLVKRFSTCGNESTARRLLIIDSNIQGMKGHFLELAMVIADAAYRLGYAPSLATSQQFAEHQSQFTNIRIEPVFSCTKVRRWSLAPHGYSRLRRDLFAQPIGGTLPERLLQKLIDHLHGDSPRKVLETTKLELIALLERFRPAPLDHILFSTADDFVLLIASAALSDLPTLHNCKISFLWHNPVTFGRACETIAPGKREQQTRDQLCYCLTALKHHQVQFFSTTEELRFQYESQILPKHWTAVEYPIRGAFRPTTRDMPVNPAAIENLTTTIDPINKTGDSHSNPLRVICGGGQRSEKGANQLGGLIDLLWDPFLKNGRTTLGLQLDENTAKKLADRVPQQNPNASEFFNPLEISKSSLNAKDYLQWIRSADVGLFLYDSRRYYTRCSGVLIEMIACGKPVIVPAGCWLSRQIATANNNYLMDIYSQSDSQAKPLLQPTPLSTRQSNACIITLQTTSTAQVLRFKVKNATSHSYIAIELATQALSGVKKTRLHVLELINGECRLLLRRTGYAHGEPEKTQIVAWSPYGERGLVLSSLESKPIAEPDATLPETAIGIAFARMEDLPACIDEITKHYDSYISEVLKFQPKWAEQHSGDQFVAKLFQSIPQPTLSEC